MENRSFCLQTLVSSLSLVFAQSALAASAIELAPLIKEGGAAELILEDSILPKKRLERETIHSVSRSGNPASLVSDTLAMPLRDPGVPGGLSSIAATGGSADEVSMQIEGIPLNPALSGGVDLTAFPSFLWGDIAFRTGPGLGSADPRGVAGVAEFQLWTAQALHTRLDDEAWGGSLGRSWYTSAGLFQVSAASHWRDRLAANIGMSVGRVRGPSGSASLGLGRASSGAGRATLHFLGTSVDADAWPTFGNPAPRVRNARVIPILEHQMGLGGGWEMRSQAFYDGQDYSYYTDTTETSQLSRNLVQQAGASLGVSDGATVLGLMGRGAFARVSGFAMPNDGLGLVHFRHRFSFKDSTDWAIEPGLQAFWASAFGVFPQASLGARWRWVGLRVDYARKLPSLQDRYYVFGGFSGNPGLISETIYGARLSVFPIESDFMDAELRGIVQYRANPFVSQLTTVVNGTSASLASVTGRIRWAFLPFIEVEEAVTYQHSVLNDTGLAFPLMPQWIGVGRLALFTEHLGPFAGAGSRAFSVSLGGRVQSNAVATASGGALGGFTLWDLRAQVAPRIRDYSGLKLWGAVENLTDRAYEVVAGTPAQGRAFSIGLEAAL